MFSTLSTDYHTFLNWTWTDIAPYYQDLTARSLDAAAVDAWLADWTRIGKTVAEMFARLHLATTLDTADAAAEQRYMAFLSDVQPKVEEAEQQLKQKLLGSGLQPIGFEMPLRNLRAEADLFREANLPLILEARKIGQQYNKIVGAQSVLWQGQEVTLQQLRPIGLTDDRSVREQVWRLAAQRWLADRGAINDLWRQAVPLRQQIARNADHPDFRSYAWRDRQRFDYTPDNCLEFHAAIEEVVVPAASRIYERARQRLGVDVIRPWDLDLDRNPISLEIKPPFKDGAELMAKTAAVFAQVDPQLGEYYATMQRAGLLDLDNRKGKAPGAFCTEFLVAEQPFIFMNSVGLRDDVRTMLHESGHAFHVFETLHLPYIQQLNITMEIAEVASMAMELLASPYLSDRQGGFYGDADFAQDRAMHLERIILFWPYMAMVDAFQHWAYTHADGNDPAACDAQWTELANRFMPGVDWRGLEAELMTGWHRKQHIHRSPFYYVEYGLAQLGAVQVWRNALKDQAGALAAYRRALSLGATKPLPELYAAANVKFAFDAGTLREAVDLIESHIEQLAV